MNTISFISNSTMKISCRFLIGKKNPVFFVYTKYHHSLTSNLSGNQFNFDKNKQLLTYPFRILGFRTSLNNTQNFFCLPNVNLGQSRLISRSSYGGYITRTSRNRGVSVVASVSSQVRDFSTSVETRVNDQNFERIYMQNGIGVKPLAVEIGEAVVDNGENENGKNYDGGEGIERVRPKREESDMEKEAWKLLNDAVVMYCGSPVGTVAANDPADKLPLNYDQVFIRDFVPSALAFLLKGEGEIVKNFLLHTLQLQVFALIFFFCWIHNA